jgi:uncharacterized membrane protein YeaQ/YmgE (transglycosylase-associated protein family)
MSLPLVHTTIPVDDEPASVRLRLVTLYFGLAAGLSVLRILFISLLALWGPSNVGVWFREAPIQSMIAPIIGAIGLVWTTRALRNRSRMAWIPALLALATPLFMSLVGRPLSISALVTALVGILVLISVRKELD